MSDWGRHTNVGYKKWKDTPVSAVTHRTGRDRLSSVSEGRCEDDEIYVHSVPTVLAQVEVEDGCQAVTPGCGRPSVDTFTVEDAVEVIGFGKFQWKLSMVTGMSWIADSMEMMILSILAPQLHCEWRLPSWQVALITSVVFIGMMLSSSLWGKVCDRYGRKTGLRLCMVWTLYYGFLSSFSPVYSWIIVLRGLMGFGIGGAPQSVTLYSEFLPVKSRATCIIATAVFWAIGAVFEVLLAILVMPSLGWRWLLALSTIPLWIFLASSFWLPESARFDVLTGNSEKALATLKRIASDNGAKLPKGKIVMHRQDDRGKITDLLAPEFRKTTLLLWVIWFANTFSYYGLVLLTTELFQAGDVCSVTNSKAKIEPSCSLECSYLTLDNYKDLLWTTLAEFPGLFFALWVVDRIGRRKSMALCFCMFSFSILPIYACIGRTALTVIIFTARAFITGGFQATIVYTPEVYPTATRAIGIGTSSGVARIGALLTPFVAQSAGCSGIHGFTH
ncbi:synaptic vesicle 2-related protein-like isoform X2 [Denticeps clupeoides]|uniref:synaptic vesicle 2-related protein-like isoform X2 n=1 Tax=Denticeps clupeoides TaxID=299321 RepID=UPI0010A36634|nr:synaptic vesicle 2-related protein-like isoform X2 [Denticeps clupeoides]